MFLKNKYTKWYFNIINNAKKEQRKKIKKFNLNYIYYESHHIIPKCLGGTEMVLLTAKEHFICHLLLCRMLTGNNKHKMINALIKMTFSKSNGQKRYTSKSFNVVKLLIHEKNIETFHERSEKMKGKNNPMFGKCGKNSPRFGMFHNDETKKKISNSNKGKLIGDKNPSKRIDVKQKISKAKKGIPLYPDRNKNPRTKISTEDKKYILELWDHEKKNGMSGYKFCFKYHSLYGVSKSGISNIIYKK